MAIVRRKTKGVRRSAAASSRVKAARRAKAKTGSVMDAVMGLLPFSEEQLHRVFLTLILGCGLAVAGFIANLAGLPAMAQHQISVLAGDSGFVVRNVTLRGVKRINALKVYERVQLGQPMTDIDLAAIREDLITLNWVQDARVSRQLPDVVVVDIVERTPHAVLKKPDRFVLIDSNGVELEPISEANAKGMLVISGPGAGKYVTELEDLFGAAPALKSQVSQAEWAGNRRWNLIFRTGQMLALPEGDALAKAALIQFAQLDGKSRLLGGKPTTFDMRVPERIYLRVPGRAQEIRDARGGG